MTDFLRPGKALVQPGNADDVYGVNEMPKLRPDAPLSPELAARFFSRLRISTSGCWEWTGTPDKDGYGQLTIAGRHYAAHRLSYLLFVGPIDDALVLHRCDNPPCANPSHLFLGTQSDNRRDMYAKGRSAPYARPHSLCNRGHDLSDPVHGRIWGKRRERRICITCYRSAAAARRSVA